MKPDINDVKLDGLVKNTNPEIFVISRPKFEENYEEISKFIHNFWVIDPNSTDAERIIEFSGRLCYMSFGEKQSPKSNREYIRNLIKKGHESVLEHANWTFVLKGVTRAFTHQLVRHRVGFSFSQLSQQYHDESGATFLIPTDLKKHPALANIWRKSIEQSLSSYKEILEELTSADPGFTPRDGEKTRRIRTAARSLLPNATGTVISVTANARALRHFLTVRGAIEGDEEMRLVSTEILKKIGPDAPSVFEDFRAEIYDDGSPIVRKKL